MSAPTLHSITEFPSWVFAVERARHIFERNQAELSQICLIAAVGAWLLLPGASWSPIVTEDFRLFFMVENHVGLFLVLLGVAHGHFLWRRWYCLRKFCAGVGAVFWFCYASASFHAAPLDVLSVMCGAQSLFSAITFWRMRGR